MWRGSHRDEFRGVRRKEHVGDLVQGRSGEEEGERDQRNHHITVGGVVVGKAGG